MTHQEWLSALRVGSLWVIGLLAVMGIAAVLEIGSVWEEGLRKKTYMIPRDPKKVAEALMRYFTEEELLEIVRLLRWVD